jgi:hypothetical protein
MKGREFLEPPENYPGLVERARASVCLRVWLYPSFEPQRSWAVIRAKEGLFLRRIVWDQQRRGGGLRPPDTYGSETPLANSVFDMLQAELQAIELPPFLPVPTIGVDGTSYGVETGSYMPSARLAWWHTLPEAWGPLRNWHARAAALFDSLLPPATPDCSGQGGS